MDSARIAIVIPCLNEAGNIPELYRRLGLELEGRAFRCVFVDDGSSDNTLEVARSLSRKHGNVDYISLSRNFGQQSALLAGIEKTDADAVIMMDADLQQSPSVLPRLIARWEEGYEIVSAVRVKSAGKGLFKRATSRLFYAVFHFLTGLCLKPGSTDFCLIDRKVADLLRQCPEYGLFIRGMLSWCGFRHTWVEFEEDRRFSGKTKYPLGKMLELTLSGVTSFSIRPLRLSLLFAALFAVFAIAVIIYALYVKAFTYDAVPGWASLAVLVSLASACNMVLLGVTGEYVGRTFMQTKNRPRYVVRETSLAAGGDNLAI